MNAESERGSVQTMIEARIIHDVCVVESTLREPHVYAASRDDGCPADSADFRITAPEKFIFVGMYDGDEYLGLYMLEPQSAAVVKLHTCLLKSAWNGRTDKCASVILQWCWDYNSSWNRIVTDVPASNTAAREYAERAGLSVYGVNPGSWLLDGELHDVVLLGITRPKEDR